MGDPAGAFAAALRRGDVAAARALLGTHAELTASINDPLAGLSFDQLPIHAAVGSGSRELVDLLIASGADINARSRRWAGGFGVLDVGDPALLPFLTDRGAIVDVHAAARLGRLDRLQALVTADPALVHARGGDGQTPLHVAATVQIAEYLLQHGADIDARDVDHESTPAQYLIRERQGVARHLVSRGAATDILMASALGDLPLVRRHLDADPASIRMAVSDRYFPKKNPQSGGTIYIWTLGHHKTAHAVARQFGHHEVFRFLMERSPASLRLAEACETEDDEMVRSLLASDPHLVENLPDEDRRRVADAACNDDLPAVRRMLEAGWPADARGEHGGTPLHWAAWIGSTALVREILSHAPPLELKDAAFGASPLGWAIYGSVHSGRRRGADYPRVVQALLDAGAIAPPVTPEMQASDDVPGNPHEAFDLRPTHRHHNGVTSQRTVLRLP